MAEKFKRGDRVRVHIYNHHGQLLGAIEGTVSDVAPDKEVSPGVSKNLIWVTGLEDYRRQDASGRLREVDEDWFSDTVVEKIEDASGQPVQRLFLN